MSLLVICAATIAQSLLNSGAERQQALIPAMRGLTGVV
jgi:hypothetical protein